MWQSYRSKNYFFEKPLKNACRNIVTLWYLFRTKIFIFLPFFRHFFHHIPTTQTITVIGLFFELAMKNWAMNMHFNPIHILSGFLCGEGAPNDYPPPGYAKIQTSHPYRVKNNLNNHCGKKNNKTKVISHFKTIKTYFPLHQSCYWLLL